VSVAGDGMDDRNKIVETGMEPRGGKLQTQQHFGLVPTRSPIADKNQLRGLTASGFLAEVLKLHNEYNRRIASECHFSCCDTDGLYY